MTHSKTAMGQIHEGRDFSAEEVLLLRIRDDPKNNTLRLEFADLIAETEPDHAALIRIDCGDGNVDERTAILQRIQSTLPKKLANSIGDIKGGFFDQINFKLQETEFLKHHQTLFRWAPCVKRLDLIFAADEIAQIAALPSLCRYTELNFWDALLSQGRAAQLADSPHLSQLEVLGLYDSSLYNEDLEAILRSTAYPSLRELDISNQREGQNYNFKGFKVLAESVFAPTLEALKMNRRCFFGEEIIPIIKAVPRLHHLEIEGLDFEDTGLIGLAGLENKWTSLNLERCDISAEGMKAFCESDGVKTLTTLNVGNNKLGEEGVNMLLNAPLSNLENLSLDWEESGIGEAFGEVLAAAAMALSLQSLSLSYAKPGLGPNGTVALSRAPLTALQRLGLHGNAIGDVGIKAIALSPNLGALRFLDIGDCGITDEGGRALANSPNLKHLKWIELGGAELSEEVRKALKSRFGEGVKFEYPWTRSRFGL